MKHHFYDDDRCENKIIKEERNWDRCMHMEIGETKQYYMYKMGGAMGDMEKGEWHSGANAIKATAAAVMAFAASQF